SKKRPMILIYEDWHWVDDTSDALLKHMVSLIAPHEIMMLVIYRPDYPAKWGNWSHHTPLILNALDLLNCGHIIKSIWKTDQLPEGIVPLIHDRTGGNAFFVEEISRTLIEEGIVERNNGQALLTKHLENLSLPNTVQAVIRARLDRLDRYSRESLRLASVIGREFAHRILERISASREQIGQALETLKLLELIQQTQVVPEAAYMFKHVITQEVTYATLLKQKRKELHTAVGKAIEELYIDRLEEFSEMLAYHFLRGEDWERAYKYNREAGLKAQSLSAYIEAHKFLEAALISLHKLPQTQIHRKREIDLRFNMRSALFPLGRHDDWADHIRVAESLAKEINDKSSLASAYNYLSSHHWIHGRHQEAIKLGEKNLRLAQSIGNFSVEVTSKFHLGIPLLYTGNIDRQVVLHREVAEQLSGPAALKRHGLSSVPAITARGYLAWGLAELGNFEEAEKWAQEGLELSGQVRNHFSTSFAQACIGLAYLRKGNLDSALDLLLKANTICREADMLSIYSFVAGSLGNAYLLKGSPEKALPILFEAIDRHYFDSSVIPPIYTITVLAEAYQQQGQIDKAVMTSEKALNIFQKNQERCFGAWALYVSAKIQSNNTQEQMAQQSLIRAIDLARATGMRPLLAHCYLELGKLSSRLRNDEARSHIQKAVDLYRSLDMQFWLPEAEEILLNTDSSVHLT
ncbi:MAG: tetratricopeptide repeat protein, partial [Desulfobulbia bacterium]